MRWCFRMLSRILGEVRAIISSYLMGTIALVRAGLDSTRANGSFNFNLIYVVDRSCYKMARGKATANITGKWGFVPVDFSYLERETITEWSENRSLELGDFLLKVGEKNFKFSCKSDRRDGLWIITLTDSRVIQGRKESPIYMIKHVELDKALWAAIYFFSENLNDGEVTDLPGNERYNW